MCTTGNAFPLPTYGYSLWIFWSGRLEFTGNATILGVDVRRGEKRYIAIEIRVFCNSSPCCHVVKLRLFILQKLKDSISSCTWEMSKWIENGWPR